jgi:excisionase family DNA binding protein
VYDRGVTASRRNAPEPATLMTDRQVAAKLGVSARTVREYRYEGQLSTVKLGYRTVRVPAGDVERLIRSRTTRA